MLDQLESEIKSRVASAENVVPGLNKPGLTTNTTVKPMVGTPSNIQSLLDKYK